MFNQHDLLQEVAEFQHQSPSYPISLRIEPAHVAGDPWAGLFIALFVIMKDAHIPTCL